jgi:hypothetical protein
MSWLVDLQCVVSVKLVNKVTGERKAIAFTRRAPTVFDVTRGAEDALRSCIDKLVKDQMNLKNHEETVSGRAALGNRGGAGGEGLVPAIHR